MSCEIICCEVPNILHAVASDTDSAPLVTLFSILDEDGDIDAHRAGYLEKVLSGYLEKVPLGYLEKLVLLGHLENVLSGYLEKVLSARWRRNLAQSMINCTALWCTLKCVALCLTVGLMPSGICLL